ncbi:MAG: cytochrome c [Caldilineaceae bacterium]|nr:cytochrome c [Caldilineaceae bacterium]
MKSRICRLFLFCMGATLCLWLLAACSAPVDEEKVLAAGKEIYTNQCSHCHQEDGQGYAQIYPQLAGNPIVLLDDPAPMIEIVLHGRSSMPSYMDELTGEQRAEVISYVRNAWGNKASLISTSQAY